MPSLVTPPLPRCYPGALATENLNDVSVGSSQIVNNRAGVEGGGFFVGTSSVLRLFWTSLWQGNVCAPTNPGKNTSC